VALLIASKLIAGGRGLAPALVRRAASVELDWDTRQKSRFEALDSLGRRIAVFLPRGRIVRGGDVLVGEDGSLIAVRAAAQAILIVTAGSDGAPLDLLRAAYHLGNRHVPLEVQADRLQLEPDHVLVELLGRMGLHVETANGPFEPEAGAYDTASSGHGHVQAGGDEHAHDHAHGHDRDHDHVHGHAHGDDPAHRHADPEVS
jgi:urease accessory protein